MFTVGQKVEYIHIKVDGREWGQITPDPGATYSVRAVGSTEAGDEGILLNEIRNAPRYWRGGTYEMLMDSRFFRPLVENKSETSFTTGADPESEKFDNRVRRSVRA
jgi:hypothetical protein